ncbi:MAG: tetratricopeptide repeat protein [Pleurocapsa sp. MO_192.B19]|nr:tetratricopeptide repeat protein [Pleurocapsa sp. MO_192.B19]
MRVNELLYQAVTRYQQILTQIEKANSPPQAERIFKVLLARDAVQDALQRVESPPASLLLRLAELDKRLQKQQARIIGVEDYPCWRKSIQPPDSAWWWYFPNPTRPWWTHLDWLWNGLTLVFLAISVSLIVDGIPRFLSGGLDTASVLAVIIPSLLALLTSGTLTPIGREARNYLFQKLDQSLWPLLSLLLSLALALSLIVIHEFFFDDLAVSFHHQGKQFYEQEQWEQALSNYQKAVALDPSYAQAHYDLGIVYEELQQFDKAKTEYLLAVRQDNSASSLIRLQAYNNWGRLLILKKEYTQAITPLIEGKNALDEEQVKTNKDFQKVKYALLKNLGWAQLELKNYSEAKSLLQEAITLNSTIAPAYCLLAQVLEAQAQKDEALKNWNNCVAYADLGRPDEYLWLSIAREKLKKGS